MGDQSTDDLTTYGFTVANSIGTTKACQISVLQKGKTYSGDDRECQLIPGSHGNGATYVKLDQDGRDLIHTACRVRKRQAGSLPYVTDLEIILPLIAEDRSGHMFCNVHEELRGNGELVLKAVQSNPFVLAHVGEHFKADPLVVRAAVQRHPHALAYASATAKSNRDLVQYALNMDATTLQHASDNLQNERDVVLFVVRKNGHALRFASTALQDDRDVVVAAMEQTSTALTHASNSLQLDIRAALSADVFKVLDIDGDAELQATELLPFLKANGFGYNITKAQEFCADLGHESGLRLEEFQRLLDVFVDCTSPDLYEFLKAQR